MAELTKKERVAIPAQQMPERPGNERNKDFKEVNLGLSQEQAVLEASRCLQCKNPPCVSDCPVSVNIPEFIRLISERKFIEAALLIRRDNSLPAITGRVCPQEKQCQSRCLRGKIDSSVAIGWLERFAADYLAAAQAAGEVSAETMAAKSDAIKVAVVGSGPAGLACAGELARMGYAVTVFEAFHKAGGVLVYGIPEFRLPNDIVEREVQQLKSNGVVFETNVIVGRTVKIHELMEEEHFKAVFIANGAGLPSFMGITGENLKGVYSANEYLTRSNLMGAFDRNSDTPITAGKKVCVVGGGNTAMDAVRTSIRLGSEQSHLVYRRDLAQMPARIEEVHHAEQEGVIFDLLTSPIEILADENGWVSGIKCVKMQLKEADASGRQGVTQIPNSEFIIECDQVIMAIGIKANPLLTAATPELNLNAKGYIQTDATGMTSIPGVFAGGDIVRGAATVILAMGDGKKTAESMNNWLSANA
ncbi:MAG: NADPH-dependent glutamate synthase [Sedimentisphaerales bacterium]|nr:NADPH-dependent glutamate synthase [Sedimentisphaerales bacterium]